MKRVYISGGITGIDNFFEIFREKQEQIESNGYEVINPALLGNIMPSSSTWQEYMDICIPLLKMCDYIVMLENWEKSKGATEELKFALSNGIKQLSI